MKTFVAALMSLSLAVMAQAQSFTVQPPAPLLSRGELKDLTGPIALYPDPLIALILPAATFPTDVVMAARLIANSNDASVVDDRPWDDSVKGLARYPDVLRWMDENLEWTTQLGDAYLAQPEDVMDAIQELRAQAESVGNLADSPQQRILREDERIRIVPANPQYIYVPQYVPEVVYYERPVAQPPLMFGLGYLAGPWLRYDFDWHHRRLYCGDWHRHEWDYRYDRSRQRDDVWINHAITNYQPWHVDERRRSAAVKRVSSVVSNGLVARQSQPRSSSSRRDDDKNSRHDHGTRFELPKPKKPTFSGSRDSDHRSSGGDERRGSSPPMNKSSKDKGHDGDRDGRGIIMNPKTNPPGSKGDDRSDRSRSDNKPKSRGDDDKPKSRGDDSKPKSKPDEPKRLIPIEKLKPKSDPPKSNDMRQRSQDNKPKGNSGSSGDRRDSTKSQPSKSSSSKSNSRDDDKDKKDKKR